jgi:DNA-binding CsgD family transcriptional regulator
MATRSPGDGVLVVLDGATARSLLEVLAAAVAAAEAGRRDEPLTPRENEVLLCLSAGKNYGQIAAELVIELETVRTHARRVRRKLGVATSRDLHGRVAPPGEPGPARNANPSPPKKSPPDHLPLELPRE